ncbi:TonB-dependent receptor [Lunatibacter salilacus]|uniref:TonB-dependent receptor n=1 Tax=Lunatibacter salilacus TaxID=2483804 RepID=UPI00131C67B2|nr:TonB-dependent receptor [Lunatibacter salilacus]
MRIFLCCLAIVCFMQKSFGQRVTISGTVKESASGETLIGANIYDRISQKGAVTNTYGFYSYTTQTDSVDLYVSFVGFQPARVRLILSQDTTLNIQLSLDTMLEEVVVSAESMDQIQEVTRMSTINIPIKQIKELPALMGEVDVFKILQLLPGVQSGTGGASGLYVRGGGPDQNLILLDGVPVYNASHLFGFFSVFNADAINNVELIKGGFPLRYGGRLSSVIDQIHMEIPFSIRFPATLILFQKIPSMRPITIRNRLCFLMIDSLTERKQSWIC